MTSQRQLEANRRNALQSTGPWTVNGRNRSRHNAVRHGLTAETVIPHLEDADDYRVFESTIVSEYEPRTPVEFELVVRLASLLWRLRRATRIENGLLGIQAEILHDIKTAPSPASPADPDACVFDSTISAPLRNFTADPPSHGQIEPEQREDFPVDAPPSTTPDASRDAAQCFLRLANFDVGAFDRLVRYEASLWRQAMQITLMVQTIRRRTKSRLLSPE